MNFDWKETDEGYGAKLGDDTLAFVIEKTTYYNCGISFGSIDIVLNNKDSKESAMKHCEDYFDSIKDGFPSIESVINSCKNHYPTLFQSRNDIIDHIFFIVGTEYEWINGQIVNTRPEDYLLVKHLDESEDKLYKIIEEAKNILGIDFVEDILTLKKPKSFYPVSENYSLICLVPDNVSQDWLAFAYEAAILLMNDSESDKNKNIGKKIVLELESKFISLKNIEKKRK